MGQRAKKPLFILFSALVLVLPPLRRGLWAALGALALGWAIRRCGRALEVKGVPRPWAAGTVTLAVVLATVLVVWGALGAVWTALDKAACLLPDTAALFSRLRSLSAALPDGLGALAQQGVAALEQRSAQLREAALLRAAELSARALTQVPQFLFFLFIVSLSAFYAAIDWERLSPVLGRAVPEEWRRRCAAALTLLRQGLRRWLAVQGRLMLLQFLLITGGLLLLGQRSPGGVAALAALSDVLPLLGTGAVLLPLALLRWAEGAPLTALGLTALNLCCWTLRTVLEPRMVGRQAGLSPFYTLLGVYLGAQCLGAAGVAGALILASAFSAAGPRRSQSA